MSISRPQAIVLLILGLALAIYLASNEAFEDSLLGLGAWGYLAALLAGFFFTSTVTVAPASVVLLMLVGNLPLLPLSVIAGLGAVVGDYLMFRFVRFVIFPDIEKLYERIEGGHLSKVFNSHYFSWTFPVLGGLIFASPLPDEIGVTLLGLSKMSTKKFLILAFIFDTLGILLILYISRLARTEGI